MVRSPVGIVASDTGGAGEWDDSGRVADAENVAEAGVDVFAASSIWASSSSSSVPLSSFFIT